MERSRYHSCIPPPPHPLPLFKSWNQPHGSINFPQTPDLVPAPGRQGCFGSVFSLAEPIGPLPGLPLCWVPFLSLDSVADSWFGGAGGEDAGMLSVTIGRALSRGQGAPPLTLELGTTKGRQFPSLSLGCRFLMSSLLVWGPGDWTEGRDFRLLPPSWTKRCVLFLFKQGTVVKCPDSAHTEARQRLQ